MIESVLFYATIILVSWSALSFSWSAYSLGLATGLAATSTAIAHLILTNV